MATRSPIGAYHALPKTIRRRGNKGVAAILGFANFLLWLYETEQPRAVLVAWETPDTAKYIYMASAKVVMSYRPPIVL